MDNPLELYRLVKTDVVDVCNPVGLHRSVENGRHFRMHSVRNASFWQITFLPSDTSLTGCNRYF
ncbi:MAG: hypothetical protein LBE56_08815 [Tannerella sp.]|jgi:hypothetical protein|nr:hypothetical protein [Tannerella sp.]